MEFTYKAYGELLSLLEKHGYTVCSYHNYREHAKSVIIRHDIDMDIDRALRMAELERDRGVCSTYFVLVTSGFYNIFTRQNQDWLRQLCDMGHEVGLHFDEAKYDAEQTDMVQAIEQEAGLLEQCLWRRVKSVSMHRPTKKTLEADYVIQGGTIVNSYGTEFFKNHKYVSDSRRNWREDVTAIVESEAYDRLHVLTHPFWYSDVEQSARERLKEFCEEQTGLCYDRMKENMRDLEEILLKDEL
ncbi:MAG: hypothetical protein K1W10_12680 [Lachnospiraceae bacterium]